MWQELKGSTIGFDMKVDLFARRWNSTTDTFDTARFPNCHRRRGSDYTSRCGASVYWAGLDDGWYATHWMEVPKDPV